MTQRRWFLSAYVVSIGLLGVLPHVAFSLRNHGISFLQYTYDEPFYATLELSGALVPGRILSSALVRALYFVCGRHLDLTLIASDFVFPCACALAALYAAGCITRRLSSQLVIATLLLFGQELVSLESSAVWTSPTVNIRSLRQALGPWGGVLIPNAYTSYFTLYRTPQPQATWWCVFLFLGLSYRLFTEHRETIGRRQQIAFVLVCALAALGYVFGAFAVVLFAGCLWIQAATIGPRAPRMTFLWGSLAGGAVLAGTIALTRFAQGLYSSHDPFRSRLPSLGMSVVLCLVLLGLSWALSRRLGWTDPRLRFVVVCGAVPIALMEQQVVSHVMVTASQWERYVNYQLLMFGVAIAVALCTVAYERARRRPLQRAAPALAFVVLAALVVRGQIQTYSMWVGANDLSIAQKRAVEDASTRMPAVRRIALEDASGATLLSTRLPSGFDVLADYGRLFIEPIADMPADGSVPSGREPHQRELFEQLARTGRSPDWLWSTLHTEAATGDGFYLGYLFSFKDFWGTFTDYRRVRSGAIAAQIPSLVAMYRQYLQDLPTTLHDPVIYLTAGPVLDDGPGREWQYRLIGQGASDGDPPLVVRAYLQTPTAAVDSKHIHAE